MTGSQQTDDDSTGYQTPEDLELKLSAYDSIEGRSRGIALETVELINQWSPDKPFVVHVKTTQGTGKSTGLIETVAYDLGFTAVFAPRHQDIDEDLDGTALGNRFDYHFRGKDRVCENDDYAGKHHQVPNTVSQEWCRGCHLRDSCEYFTAYRSVGSWDPEKVPPTDSVKASAPSFMAVHQHLSVLPEVFDSDDSDQPSTWELIDAVIIDESPYGSLVTDQITVELSDIRAELDVLDQSDPGDQEVADLISKTADLLDTTKAVIEDDGDTVSLFEEWTAFYEEYDENEAFDRVVGQQWGEQSDRTGSPIVLPILDAIPDLRAVIADAMESDRSLTQEYVIEHLWSVTGGDQPKLEIAYADLSPLRSVAREKPVFVLATEWPKEISEAVFDLPVVEVSDDLKPPVDVLQLGTHGAGIWVLGEDKRLARNLRELTTLAVRRETLRNRKTLIVSKKALKGSIRDALDNEGFVEGDDYEIAHYYGLSGSNKYEDCEAVVLHGKPGYPDEVLKLNQLMTGISDEELSFEKCQGEMRDALHRIRPAQKDGVRAYIWSNTPDFRTDFDESHVTMSVPRLREKLTSEIEAHGERIEREDHVVEKLDQWDGWMTGTEFKTEIGEQYLAARDRLVEQGRIEHTTESEGRGRPTKKYRS